MTATATRPASSKSIGFLRTLFQDRNLLADSRFFDRVNAMDKAEYAAYLENVLTRCAADQALCSKTIDWAKALPFHPKPASDKQLVFIAKLVDEKLLGDERDEVLAKIDRREYTGGREGTASALIDRLMAMPKLAKGSRSARLPEVPKGRYAIDSADGVLTFYHVGERQGELVIDVKAGPATHEIPFTEAGYTTILQAILDAGLKAATIRYGLELGCCGVCGRDLTDETSRAQGIGPVCSQRF